MSSPNDNTLSPSSSTSSTRRNPGRIHVTIKAQDGSKTKWDVKSHLTCKALFKNYCGKRDMKYRAVSFLYNGRRINKHSRTFEELGFGDKVEIDVMEQMNGGGGGI